MAAGTHKLKFCANLSFLFPDVGHLPSKYFKAKEAEFTAVECGNDIYNYSIEELTKARQDTGLKQAHMNAYTGDTKGYTCMLGKAEEFKESLERSIKYCKALQCQRLHVMSGVYPENRNNLSEQVLKSHHDVFVRNLKLAANRAKEENITILIEPISVIPNYFLETTKQAINILNEISETSVKLQLDFFHQQRNGGNHTEVFKNHQKLIGHVQVSQVPNRNEPDQSGEINYKYIFNLLQECQYDGWIGCEYRPSLAPEETFNWMKPYL